MGTLQQIIQRLLNGGVARDKAAAPYQQTSNISPQENYAGYTQLPGLSNMSSAGDYYPDPNRLHAPFQVERGRFKLVNNYGVHLFDAGDESIIEVPTQPLQQYFNEVEELPPVVPTIPAHGVFVPTALFQRGYAQTFVPSFGMRPSVFGATPAVLLSHPINVRTVVEGTDKRASLTGARAHAPKRGVL